MTRLHLAPAEMSFQRHLAIHSSMAGPLDQALLSKEFRDQLPDEDEAPFTLPPSFRSWRPFEQLQYFDLTIRLPEFVNHALDRASMAFGVEVRVPFLDHELVELFSRIQPKLKMRGFREKHILREALRGVLPEQVRTRPKHALSAPFQQWWRGSLPGFAVDALSKRSLREKGYFEPDSVHDLLDRHRRGSASLGYHLTAVLAVQMWHATFQSVARASHA